MALSDGSANTPPSLYVPVDPEIVNRLPVITELLDFYVEGFPEVRYDDIQDALDAAEELYPGE